GRGRDATAFSLPSAPKSTIDGTQTFQSVRPAEFYSADASLNRSGESPAGRAGPRPVFGRLERPRRLSSQGSGLRLRRRSPLVQTPLQVRAIQYFRHAFHLREGVIKMRAYPQPTAVRAINA